jgi:hypothetical protein
LLYISIRVYSSHCNSWFFDILISVECLATNAAKIRQKVAIDQLLDRKVWHFRHIRDAWNLSM